MTFGAYVGALSSLFLLIQKDRHRHGPFYKKLDPTLRTR